MCDNFQISNMHLQRFILYVVGIWILKKVFYRTGDMKKSRQAII